MSGVGKSFWARKLRDEHGFLWHDCDEVIAQRLGELITPEEGEPLVQALGRWMGHPWEPGYDEREAEYLALEEKVTRASLEEVMRGPPDQVLDTTGSVVYLPQPVLDALRSRTRVVYLRTPPRARAAMLELYRREPKPVVWAGLFERGESERPEHALPRCYAELLTWRDTRYAALAHAMLDGSELDDDTGCAEILRAARA